MDNSLVFHKTAKGQDEMDSRRYHLDSRHRVALILVDGKSDLKTLHAKAEGMADLDALLEDLAVQGFIAAANATWQPTADPGSSASGPELMRRELVDVAIMVLGKKSDKVGKILREADSSYPALAEAGRRCVKLVRLTIDEAKADELGIKFQGLLGRYG